MSILITGGAGYIGSHTAKYFNEKQEQVLIYDNFQTGHEQAVKNNKVYRGDIRNIEKLNKVFQENKIEAVIHFAADSLVGESMKKPFEYYHNNVYGMLCLLQVMKHYCVDKIVFSSTAAVYGEPEEIPINETDVTVPTNTYGETKLAMEKMMKWFSRAYGTQYVSLRYFNAAGAHFSGKFGEDHSPETHLIPLILQVPLGKREKVYIFGDDYPTADGTCVRDYIHVTDLADAHYLALQHLRKNKGSGIFNLGNGKGYSVREIIETARCVTGYNIPVEVSNRRDGDPAVLIASSEKARTVLGWKPQYASIERIIEDAWRWHNGAPGGYGD